MVAVADMNMPKFLLNTRHHQLLQRSNHPTLLRFSVLLDVLFARDAQMFASRHCRWVNLDWHVCINLLLDWHICVDLLRDLMMKIACPRLWTSCHRHQVNKTKRPIHLLICPYALPQPLELAPMGKSVLRCMGIYAQPVENSVCIPIVPAKGGLISSCARETTTVLRPWKGVKR
jgi:hypothetical protein